MDYDARRALSNAIGDDFPRVKFCEHHRFLSNALSVQIVAKQIPTIGMLRREMDRHDAKGCSRCPSNPLHAE